MNTWFGKWLMVGVSLIVLLGVAGCAKAPSDPASLPPAPLKGREAPEFVLRDLDGNTVRLSDYRGKVVMLNFFATW